MFNKNDYPKAIPNYTDLFVNLLLINPLKQKFHNENNFH